MWRYAGAALQLEFVMTSHVLDHLQGTLFEDVYYVLLCNTCPFAADILKLSEVTLVEIQEIAKCMCSNFVSYLKDAV